MPWGKSNNLLRESAYFQLSTEKSITQITSLGLEFGHSLKHSIDGELDADIDRDGAREILKVTTDESVQVFQVTPFIKFGKSSDYGIRGERWARKYFLIGAGYYRVGSG